MTTGPSSQGGAPPALTKKHHCVPLKDPIRSGLSVSLGTLRHKFTKNQIVKVLVTQQDRKYNR